MPSIKTARAQKRKAQINKRSMSYQRSRVAAAKALIEENATAPETEAAVNVAVKALDQSAAKGVIHKRTAARTKSRLVRFFNDERAD